jgi:hypothetical protein
LQQQQAVNFSQCYASSLQAIQVVPMNMPTPAATTAAPVPTRAVRTTGAAATTILATTLADADASAGVVMADWLVAVVAVSAAVALVCAVLLVALKRKTNRAFGSKEALLA